MRPNQRLTTTPKPPITMQSDLNKTTTGRPTSLILTTARPARLTSTTLTTAKPRGCWRYLRSRWFWDCRLSSTAKPPMTMRSVLNRMATTRPTTPTKLTSITSTTYSPNVCFCDDDHRTLDGLYGKK